MLNVRRQDKSYIFYTRELTHSMDSWKKGVYTPVSALVFYSILLVFETSICSTFTGTWKVETNPISYYYL